MSKGRHFNGLTPQGISVTLGIDRHRLLIKGDDGLLVASWDLAALNIAPISNGWRIRTPKDQGHVTTDDADLIGKLAPKPSRFKRILSLAGLSIAGITVPVMAVGVALPMAVTQLADFMPRDLDQQLGNPIRAQLDTTYPACTRPSSMVFLERLTEILSEDLPSDSQPKRLMVLESPNINALALPDGTIVIFSGLIDQAESLDEIIGVLAHEIGHLAHRHGLKAVLKNTSSGLIWSLMLGDGSGLLASAALGVSALTNSRQHEEEADNWAIDNLDALELNSHGLAQFLSRLPADDSLEILSTHPDAKARIARILARPTFESSIPDPDQILAIIKRVCE